MSSDSDVEDQWRRYKSILYELWLRKGLSTARTMARMESQYNFRANKNAFDRQIKVWGWRKSLKPVEWQVVEQRIQKRKRDHGKESMVKLSGLMIEADKRIKRPRLTVMEKLQLTSQPSAELPDSVTVCTPGAYTKPWPDVENLPSRFFFERTVLTLSQFLANTRTETQSALALTSTQIHSLEKIEAIGISETPTGVPKSLAEWIFSVAHNLTPSYTDWKQREDNERAIYTFLDELEDRMTNDLKSGLMKMHGAVIEAFFTTLTVRAFQQDRTKLADALLPTLKFDISDTLVRLSDTHSTLLVDLLLSGQMAQVFLRHRGDLTRATCPFKRLAKLRVPAGKLRGLCRAFVESKHPDCTEDLSAIARCSDKSLVRLALETHEYSHWQLGSASIEAFKLHQETGCPEHLQLSEFLWTRVPVDRIGAELLGYAALWGLSFFAQKILQRRPSLNYVGRVYRVLWKNSRPLDSKEVAVFGTPLQVALVGKHRGLYRLLLDSGADPNGRSGMTMPTPLQLALMVEDFEMAHHLLDKGASPLIDNYDRVNFEAVYPGLARLPASNLMLAARFRAPDLIDRLIDAGCDPNMIEPGPDGANETALAVALLRCQKANVHKLLQRGARLVIESDPPFSLIPIAIGRLMFHDVQAYIQRKTDINIPGRYGRTALSEALVDHEALVDLEDHDLILNLVQGLGADVNATGGHPPLASAIEYECHDCIRLLLINGAKLTGETLRAFWAEEDYHVIPRWDFVREVLHWDQYGFWATCSDARICLAKRRVPHSIAIPLVMLAVDRVLLRDDFNYFEDLKMWPEHTFKSLSGLQIEWDSSCMAAALDRIVQKHFGGPFDDDDKVDSVGVDMVKGFLKAGISPRPKIIDGAYPCCGERVEKMDAPTALMTASRKGNFDLVGALLEHKADPNDVRTSYSEFADAEVETTALLQATENGSVNIIRALVTAHADVHRPAQGPFGRTALQMAAEHGHLTAIEVLLDEYEVSPNEPPATDRGVTALEAATANGHLAIVCRLLGAYADVNAPRSHGGRTALEAATEHGRLDETQLLLNAGADISDSAFGVEQYSNAVRHAREKGFPAVVKILGDEYAVQHPSLDTFFAGRWSVFAEDQELEDHSGRKRKRVEEGEGEDSYEDYIDISQDMSFSTTC